MTDVYSLQPEQESVGSGGKMAAKIVSFYGITISMLVAQVAVIWLSTKGSLFPEAEAFQSIVGNCAQIIAGLYGITLAGYTFFLSRIDALTATDMTLDYVVSSVKRRFKLLIWYITLNVFMTLAVSIVLMYAPVPENGEHVFFYRLVCNEFLVFTGFSTVLILYYSILVIEPNCLQNEARKLKRRLARRFSGAGDAVAFIAAYDRIEHRCNAMLPRQVLTQLHDNKGARFEITIALLSEQKLLSRQLLADVQRIHRYYTCVVNVSPISVSRDMCELASAVLEKLESGKQ